MSKNSITSTSRQSSAFTRYFKDNAAILIGLLAISLFLQLTSGGWTSEGFNFMGGTFLKQKNILNVLRQVSINANLACGLTIVIILGGIDISVGSIVALSGVLAAGMIQNFGMPVWVAVAVGVLTGLLCGMINAFIISTTPLPPFIVTLSMMQTARGFAYIYTSGAPIRVMADEFNFLGSGYWDIGGFTVGQMNIFGNVVGPWDIGVFSVPIPVLYSIVLLAITAYILNRTRLGRHIYAVGGNREAARFAGINDRKVLFFAYSYSGLLAGISGVVLAARMFSGQPTAGDGQEMETIAATVLGGTSMLGGQGAMGGTIIGVLIMGALSNGLNILNINSFWQYVVKGVVILLAVYVDVLKKRTKKVKA